MIRGKAITVRFLPLTNHRGPRWVATADHPIGRVVVDWDDSLPPGEDNARTAAEELIRRWNAEKHPDDAPWHLAAVGSDGRAYTYLASHPPASEPVRCSHWRTCGHRGCRLLRRVETLAQAWSDPGDIPGATGAPADACDIATDLTDGWREYLAAGPA